MQTLAPTTPSPNKKPRSVQKRVTKRLSAQVLYGGQPRQIVVTLDLTTNQLRLRPFRCQQERVYEIVDLYHWGPQLSLPINDARKAVA